MVATAEQGQIARRLRRISIVGHAGRVTYIAGWLRGECLPRTEILPELAERLGVSVHLLTTGTWNCVPPPPLVAAWADEALIDAYALWCLGVGPRPRQRTVIAIRVAHLVAWFGGTWQVARLLSVPERSVRRWCRGRYAPRSWLLARLAARTGVSADWLCGGPLPSPQRHLPFWED